MPRSQWNGIAILTDPNGDLVTPTRNYVIPKLPEIFQEFKEGWGDVADFVAVVGAGAYHQPNSDNTLIYSQVDGLGLQRMNDRGKYGGSNRLVAMQVHDLNRLQADNLRELLHELGHTWIAYVDNVGSAVLDDFHHWNNLVVAEPSAMRAQGYPYFGLKFWFPETPGIVASGPQTYVLRTLTDNMIGYCDLDLYLMGLLDVGAARPATLLTGATNLPNGPSTATPLPVMAAQIATACGARVPPPTGQPVHFSQAFVVITPDEDTSRLTPDLTRLDAIRQQHEQNFARATRNLATLGTQLPLLVEP
jgi:hypothetical protein